MAKKQPNHSGTLKGIQAPVLVQECYTSSNYAAQEEANTGNEIQYFIQHVLTQNIDMLHKILRKEITCVCSSINTCPIITQTFDNGQVNTRAMNICLSLKYIKQVC